MFQLGSTCLLMNAVVVLTNNDHHHQLFILEVFVTPGKTNRGQVQRAPGAAVSHLHLILFH